MTPLFSELGGSVQALDLTDVAQDTGWTMFNPSICGNDFNEYKIAFRSSNYVIESNGALTLLTGSKVQNRVVLADIDEKFKVSAAVIVDFSEAGVLLKRGIEDPKLLWRDRWAFTGVIMETHTPYARNCYCHLDDTATRVMRIDVETGLDVKKPEKNWMTANKVPELFDYIYGPNSVVVGEEVVSRRKEKKELSAIRGGSHLLLLNDGTYLAVVHRLYAKESREYSQTRRATVLRTYKNYHHFFARYDEYGWMIELSEPFQFLSPGVEFAAGLTKIGDNYVVTFGKEDRASYVATISESRVRKMLKII